MPRDVPFLNSDQRNEIAETLRAWAASHPRAESPLIQLADGSELSPLDMARAVEEPDSPRGALLYRVFAAGTIEDEVERPETLDEILTDYRKDTATWQDSGPARMR
jgi:hypothetical protein